MFLFVIKQKGERKHIGHKGDETKAFVESIYGKDTDIKRMALGVLETFNSKFDRLRVENKREYEKLLVMFKRALLNISSIKENALKQSLLGTLSDLISTPSADSKTIAEFNFSIKSFYSEYPDYLKAEIFDAFFTYLSSNTSKDKDLVLFRKTMEYAKNNLPEKFKKDFIKAVFIIVSNSENSNQELKSLIEICENVNSKLSEEKDKIYEAIFSILLRKSVPVSTLMLSNSYELPETMELLKNIIKTLSELDPLTRSQNVSLLLALSKNPNLSKRDLERFYGSMAFLEKH